MKEIKIFSRKIGNNESERILPFNMWLNFPMVSPYYELLFLFQLFLIFHSGGFLFFLLFLPHVENNPRKSRDTEIKRCNIYRNNLYFLQIITFLYIGVCYFCFDNIFCIMAIHLTGQFRILRYRFLKMCDTEYQITEKDEESMLTKHAYMIYDTFKKYVRHHQALINYYKTLENVYTMIILGQVLVFSMLICLFGYQVLLAKASAARRAVFIFLLLGAMSLLFMFTYSCDGVIEHSDNVAIGSYSAMWTIMPMNEYGKMLRNDIVMTIKRSRRVCCLTAYGFFPVSLETYTTVVVSQCDMSSDKNDDKSISLTSIFMKLVGLWMASNRSEQRVRDITVGYTLIAILFAIWVQFTDMYYSWGDFSVRPLIINSEIYDLYYIDKLSRACLFTACNMLSLTMPFIKILVLLAHKEDFFRLILYLQRKFLHADYDSYERQIVIGFKRKCTFFIYFFTLFTLATVVSYIVNPLIVIQTSVSANIGKNESDRVLPFNMWVDLPLTTTPYYEIIFVLQVLSLYHIGISYFCFDNFLCIINLHVAGQFQILQYRITNMPDLMYKGKQRKNEVSYKESTSFADDCYTIFKKYIRQHQILIAYCEKLEEVFNWIILEQVLMFSLLICLDGYQVLLADAPTRTRLIFTFHITGCLCQLLMFTYSCDCIMREIVSQCDMSSDKNDDKSISLTSIFMKLVGLWMAGNRSEQRVRDITVGYTLIAILFAIWVQFMDMYYSWGDFSVRPLIINSEIYDLYYIDKLSRACLFTACNMLSSLMPFIKILVLLAHKEDFFRLILYLQRKFLHSDYDSYERQIVIGFKRKCTFFIYFLTFFTLATVASYIVNPLIANIGKNESDRVLPFNMWVDLPLTTTPYYEITFVIQVLSLYHIGISYFCFDNFLCIINLHVAGQFQILQYRITNMPDLMNKGKQRRNEVSYKESTCFADEYYTIFKKYIRQHQTLIAYCEKLEEVFNWIILEQVLMFSLLICLDGYQVLLAGAPTRTRLIFSFHIGACLCQLLMFTYSCDCIIRESMSVAIAAYKAPWPLLSMTASGRMMQKDLTLVIMRSSVPCCLTGRGFFIVSLETYTNTNDVSISLTSIFMKLVGLWIAANKSEQRVRNITVGYTMIAIIFGTWIQITDMCYSWGDFSIVTYYMNV
ncbi:hypothetical protein E2986_13967 [Frieseomelitta varia]|uniref:Odorant receptor n=1 Tax=Frieseomelitta varia TaxID=561572 RepID=A0A833S4W9_9HYME|nr:hypothetical protein E2986_13967 [Frieseomelitta varia]